MPGESNLSLGKATCAQGGQLVPKECYLCPRSVVCDQE